jgi:hypothetical protein
MHFHAENMSHDPRLHGLLQLAMRNMVNVHTLRIVLGHMKLTGALLAGFLNPNRPRSVPLRRLWLESCSLPSDLMRLLSSSNAIELESVRIRRVDAASLLAAQNREMGFLEYRPSRGGIYFEMHNGSGNWSPTTVHVSNIGASERLGDYSDAELMDHAQAFDAKIWEEHSDIEELVRTYALPVLDSAEEVKDTIPGNPVRWLLDNSSSTLTSLNLDWVSWRREELDPNDESLSILQSLAALRFPHLSAFQIRNAVMPQTALPDDVYLLEDTFLGFMEAHTKLQCLAWPMDKFYSHLKPSSDLKSRCWKLIAHLAHKLIDLRVDANYKNYGEPRTDMSQTADERRELVRRRRFIAEFVPHMRRLTHIKLEGCLPRDERREIMRALHWSPLKKIVMIGVSCPVGNTWGHGAIDLKARDPGSSDDTYNIEEEDAPSILTAYRQGFHMPENFEFEPDYGWPVHTPLVQTIALHHASTVEELKLCGYNGCPILSQHTSITTPLLSGLRQFDNLKQLIMSFWLLTWYEGSYRDTEIIKYWTESRSSSSTALVVVTPPRSPSRDVPVHPGLFMNFSARAAPQQEFNRWAVALKTTFSPSALAYRVASDIGPYLSPIAKSRPGGVCVRGSFCLGVREGRPASDIFELEVRIGKDDQVLEFTGPREEGEKGRWWQKLESRRWF